MARVWGDVGRHRRGIGHEAHGDLCGRACGGRVRRAGNAASGGRAVRDRNTRGAGCAGTVDPGADSTGRAGAAGTGGGTGIAAFADAAPIHACTGGRRSTRELVPRVWTPAVTRGSERRARSLPPASKRPGSQRQRACQILAHVLRHQDAVGCQTGGLPEGGQGQRSRPGRAARLHPPVYAPERVTLAAAPRVRFTTRGSTRRRMLTRSAGAKRNALRTQFGAAARLCVATNLTVL
jgi:hypothetical protein